MEINLNISENLTSTEKEVFTILNSIREKRTPYTTIRICGGWVRDKLVGKNSEDMDFMVDNISGSDFATIVAEELNLDKSPHVIKKNPEKTKNIEAAKMYIPVNGEKVELDFVQSRTEEYGSNRREVTTKPASAEEDAMRRDLTINALFYNINENKIEDFTGKGLKDLITNTIRAPRDSGDKNSYEQTKQTFIEDPLRVFRVIRFASKYNGNISDNTLQAIQDPEVINAIFFSERKIAPERIGQEFQKMLKDKNPKKSIELLKQTGLFQHILNQSLAGTEFEGRMEELDMEQNNPHHEMNLWGHTFRVLENLLEHFPEENNEEKRIIMILAALTHDLGKLDREIHAESTSHPGRTSYHDHEKSSEKIANYLLSFLKFENSIAKQVAGLARYHMQPHTLQRSESQEKALRKFIRRMGEQSLNWVDVFNLAVADAYSKGADINPETIKSYNQLRNQLEIALSSMSFSENEKFKPILNGHQIMSILGLKPGPYMGVLQEYLKDLQDEKPDMSEEELTSVILEIKLNAENISIQDNISIENAIIKAIGLKQGKTYANNAHKIIVASHCPVNLFKSEFDKIKNSINNNKLFEAISYLKKITEDYPDDIKVVKMTAILLFKILIKDKSLKNNELLDYILKHAEKNLYDPILLSYTIGFLILLKTPTEKKNILKMSENVIEMHPEILKGVLDKLPKEVYHKDVNEKLKSKINENN